MGTEQEMCYAARRPGVPGFSFVSVDLPQYAKENAKEIAKLIRQGATIERVTVETARAGLSEYFFHRKASANAELSGSRREE